MDAKFIFLFFWKHIKPYKWYYAAMLTPTVFASLYPLSYHYSIKLLLDVLAEVNHSLDYERIIAPIILFLSANIGIEAIWRFSQMAAWRSLPYVRRSILLYTYDYVQHHSYYYFQNSLTGSVTSKIKGVLSGYDRLWSEVHHGIGLVGLKILINISILMTVNAQVGLFLCIWSMAFFIIMYRLSQKLDRLAFAESESQHALIGKVSDKLMNITSIFAFAAQKTELNLLDKHVKEDYIPKQVGLYKYDFKIHLIGGALYIVKFAFILLYTIYLKTQGLITIGDFAFVLGLALTLSEDMWRATMSFQDILREIGDLKSAFSILQEKQKVLVLPPAQPIIITSPSIEFRNVDFSYPSKEIVFQNLNLTIAAGEKIGVVGRSGAGKSSLFNLLLRYFTCTKGQVLIDGQDINLMTEDSLRSHIAVIPQDSMLFHRTLIDNVRYGNQHATEKEVIEACKKAYIHDLIMTLPEKYQTFAGEKGTKLSGGQRQRIAIARAILKNAPILLLDEATSALDTQTEKLIQKSLQTLMEGKKQTVIAIAHRLSTLKNMDRIIVLDNGAIVEQGTHEKLINERASLYSKLWNLQIQDS
jgi:ATP-binding cassette subfamily B protein